MHTGHNEAAAATIVELYEYNNSHSARAHTLIILVQARSWIVHIYLKKTSPGNHFLDISPSYTNIIRYRDNTNTDYIKVNWLIKTFS